MNSDVCDFTDDLNEEKLLIQEKNVILDGVGKGKLSLTNKRIEFEHRRSFLSTPKIVLSCDLSEVFSAKIKDASNIIIIEALDDNSERAFYQFSFPESDVFTQIYRLLNKELRVRRQLAELQERRSSFQAFLWHIAYQTWMISGIISRTVHALTQEDWDEVDSALHEAKQMSQILSNESSLDISQDINAMSEAISIRNSPLVLQHVVTTTRSLGSLLNGELPFGNEWADLYSEDAPGLNWGDIRYIFLFGSWYNLLSLWQHLGETQKIEDSLPRMATLLSILAHRISGRTHLGIAFHDDEAASSVESVESAAHNLDALLKINSGVV
ncbi:MAG: hypothetical protein JSV02_05065 [Dehalococcoidia bacterium]|nr:MAG: hypothetical protein JSV02_05065 [Dehalococcoidia bacterium]